MTITSDVWVEHREALLRFVLSRGVESHDAEDIVHDVLMKVLTPGGGPAEPAKLRAWLFQVVRNAMTDHLRRKRPYEQIPEETAAVGVAETRPDLLFDCLGPFLSRLPAGDGEVLRLADGEGLPQSEIAAHLGLGLSATKSRIQRARTKMLKMYRDCCRVELDRRGGVVEFERGACSNEGCGGDVCGA